MLRSDCLVYREKDSFLTDPIHLQRLGTVDYETACRWQKQTAEIVREGGEDVLALLQHPPVFTFGRRIRPEHLLVTAAELQSRRASLVESERGGDITFHGPGQLVAYPIINLKQRRLGPKAYVCRLEETMIQALATLGLRSRSITGRPGVWLDGEKVGAIGVRVRDGVTTHGFALNVETDLSWFESIIACGLKDAAVTSIERALGFSPGLRVVEDAIAGAFATVFDCSLEEGTSASGLSRSFATVLADGV